MELIVHQLNELEKAAKLLLNLANGRKKFFLKGDLGAGKTTFVKAFCNVLGVKDNVSSPTYSLINEYIFKNQDDELETVYHIDLYRMKNLDEALQIGIEDYLLNDNFCLIEWADIVKPIEPEDVIKIEIETLNNSSRKILFL